MASAPRRLQFLLTMWDEDDQVGSEAAGDCPDGCLSPGMLVLGLVLMALFFVPVCVRFYHTRSCTDCSERRAKQIVNGGDP